MSRAEILEKLIPIFRDIFDDDDLTVTEETRREDIEDWDSMGHIYLIVEIEDVLGVKLEDSAAAKIRNVSDMIDLLLKQGI
ncbi:acyl carrier protein [Lachnoclostridium sp. Marseille-P6806]|uniref:acyl carrier protein n=1 Tax=Lachnoclostridium sp. Marseille-P6806 TaxID=2364793 RepID=UPI001031FAC6|nr:acyl carrier protein [Lachnoclostridium sp. Marseille-P6806]